MADKSTSGEPAPKRRKTQHEALSKNIAVRHTRTQVTGVGPTKLRHVHKHFRDQYAEQTEQDELIDIIVHMDSYLTDRSTWTVDLVYSELKMKDCALCVKESSKAIMSSSKSQWLQVLTSDLSTYYTFDTVSGDNNVLRFKPSHLLVLFECLTCLERRNTDERDNFIKEDTNAQFFYELGGIEIAKKIIMFESLPSTAKTRHRVESSELLRMKSVLFDVLGKIITTDSVGERIAKELAEDDEFLVVLFHYLHYKHTFLSACSLIEDILQNRPVLDLSTIPNIEELILSFDNDELMNFCRILAVTVSDLDVFDNKTSLYAQNKQKRTTGFVNIRDLNQDFLLQMPALIQSLVNLACNKDYSPRFQGMNGEVENWMQWIDDSNSDDLLDIPVDDVDIDDFIGAVTQPSEPSSAWVKQPSLGCIKNLVLKVETVYVLGLLLLGKHRKKAQKMVSEMNLIPGMSTLFDNFIWKVQGNRVGTRNRLAGHNASCECSPEVALKIQFMRLVHAFCDHSEYKHLLLTKSELLEVRKVNEKAGLLAIDGLDQINTRNMCKGKEGLITKIVEVMKKEPTSSTFRFWLARSVESYLRGGTSYCDQVFLLRRGLLQHVVGNMLDSDDRPKEILQSGFDLLGELIKFNVEAFKIIEDCLRNPEMRQKFIDLVNSNLVDSNMFIRSVILTFGFFTTELTEHADYARDTNFILSYVGNFQHQVNYLYDMIHLTTVMSVSQENVSCLNTTLVLLMIANKTNSLPRYLEALKAERVTHTRERRGGAQIMKNFSDLLKFWKDHYLAKDKDCSALEKSTRITFSQWKDTVEMLLSADTRLPTSVTHYLAEPTARIH